MKPLNLPSGSVRAFLAILLTGTCCALWLTGATVPNELLVFAGGVVTYYFKSRGDADKFNAPARSGPLPPARLDLVNGAPSSP